MEGELEGQLLQFHLPLAMHAPILDDPCMVPGYADKLNKYTIRVTKMVFVWNRYVSMYT